MRDGKLTEGNGRNLATLRFRDPEGGRVLLFQRIRSDTKRKDERGNDVQLKTGDIVQNSMVVPGRWWRVPQTIDTINPRAPHSEDYNPKSRYAKTMRTDNATWGDVPADNNLLAHRDENMTCFACHTSWTPTCFGCHLSMSANRKTAMLHNEGLETRNYTSYNYDVLRDDVYMLGIDGTVTGHRIAPTRSTCAVVVSSQNANRDWLYYMQQTISAEGYSGQAFNTHVPHTVRATETKVCSDCHLTADGANREIILSIVSLAKSMNFDVIAEGSRCWAVYTGGDYNSRFWVERA